jgi:hypothetical protein
VHNRAAGCAVGRDPGRGNQRPALLPGGRRAEIEPESETLSNSGNPVHPGFQEMGAAGFEPATSRV